MIQISRTTDEQGRCDESFSDKGRRRPGSFLQEAAGKTQRENSNHKTELKCSGGHPSVSIDVY